jgi:subtilisin
MMMPTAAQAATAPYIVVLKPGADVTKAVSKAKGVGATVSQTYNVALSGFAANIPTDKVSVIAADASVAFVAADGVVSSGIKPPNKCTTKDCQVPDAGILRIDAEESSTRSGDGQGAVNVNVAVFDSGVGPHSDLNIAGGKSCNGTRSIADESGHGTAVAGIIAAKDNNFGTVGVAPGARIWSVKVLDRYGNGRTSNILCGLDWVVSTRSDGDPGNDIQVANMSLNDSGQDDGACGTLNRDPVHRAICAGAQAGIAFAVSAGNASQDFVGTIPSNYDEVLTVTAMNDYDGAPGGNAAPRCAAPSPNPDDAPASYSNYTTGSELAHTVAAPGTCLQSLYPGDRYVQGLLGTSFAAPHGAGVAALCISTGGCSGLNGAQIASKLHNDAVAYNNANPKYGFTGDLLRPLGDGRIYGPLIHAGSY